VLAATILLGAGASAAWAAPAAVDLGTAASFAVLAGGGVTDTGPSTIVGDVGTHPLPAIPDLLDKEASGDVDRAGAKSQQAQRDLATALASAAALPRDGTVSLSDDRTLLPGVYAVGDDKQDLAASLTLDGQNAPNPVWVFVMPADLVTVPGSAIQLVNGALACNIFWRVGGSATLAAGSTFAGSILATTSVAVGRSVTIDGRLLARTGAVTLAGARITVPACTPATTKPAAQAISVDAQSTSSRLPGSMAAEPSTLPVFVPFLVFVLLVAAALLGEPRRGRPPSRRGGW
jgi:hypothetical protein